MYTNSSQYQQPIGPKPRNGVLSTIFVSHKSFKSSLGLSSKSNQSHKPRSSQNQSLFDHSNELDTGSASSSSSLEFRHQNLSGDLPYQSRLPHQHNTINGNYKYYDENQTPTRQLRNMSISEQSEDEMCSCSVDSCDSQTTNPNTLGSSVSLAETPLQTTPISSVSSSPSNDTGINTKTVNKAYSLSQAFRSSSASISTGALVKSSNKLSGFDNNDALNVGNSLSDVMLSDPRTHCLQNKPTSQPKPSLSRISTSPVNQTNPSTTTSPLQSCDSNPNRTMSLIHTIPSSLSLNSFGDDFMKNQSIIRSGRQTPYQKENETFSRINTQQSSTQTLNRGKSIMKFGSKANIIIPTSKSSPSLSQKVRKSCRSLSIASIRSSNLDDPLASATSSPQNSSSTVNFSGDGTQGSFPPSATIITTSILLPLVYPAMLSKVAQEFRNRIILRDHLKNELTYTNSFTGSEAVDLVAFIMKTPDRNLATLLGRALDAQKFFHDVTYEHRLRDHKDEVYQFNEIMVNGQDNNDEKATEATNSSSTSLDTGFSSDSVSSPITQPPSPALPTSPEKNPRAATVPVNGVFVIATNCYSPTCTRDMICYSITCPRRLEQQARLNMKPNSVLKHTESRLSLQGEEKKEQKLWVHTVPKEISDSVSDKERKRQEVICELIYTERSFVKDLEYLRDFWIKPLCASKIIPDSRRESFLRVVFGTIQEIHAINAKLADALTKRQQQTAVVRNVGDVFFDHVPNFEPYVVCGQKQVYAKYEFEREKSVNPAFAKFVDETERLKESRKLELNGYLTKPITRLARYPLFLDAILKATEEANPDKQDLPRARTLIREFLNRVNIESGKAENRLSLMQLNQSIRFRPNEKVDLKLTDKDRQIIFKGNLKKRTQDKENQGDVQVYLFDNSLLCLRSKIVNKRRQLTVYRKPIPLELLVISESDNIPGKGSNRRTSPSLISSATKVSPIRENSQKKYPLMFQYLGRNGYGLVLYASTFIGRKKWVEHIAKQKQVLRDKADIYTRQILMANFFDMTNRVNCVTPLDGGRKLLYGTDNGIWISDTRASTSGGRVTSTPQKAIHMASVVQIDVMEEYNILLALSGKTLYTWPLDCLETLDAQGNERRARKVLSRINFYKVGICLGRILVCTVDNGSSTSYIKVLEPADPIPRGKRPQLRKLLQGQSEGFRLFKERYVSSEVKSVSFLTNMMCVGSAKGFELVSLQSNETRSLLDPADTSLEFVTRQEALKPLAIWKLHGSYLLNYSDFSFYVNSSGRRLRENWEIRWEGSPQKFALSYPYVIGFERNFVEIRHVETGALVRVITGENLRFLHENTQEIIYVYEDENGSDVVATLDFWGEKHE